MSVIRLLRVFVPHADCKRMLFYKPICDLNDEADFLSSLPPTGGKKKQCVPYIILVHLITNTLNNYYYYHYHNFVLFPSILCRY